ncbi:MAG: hypothetical protein N3F63_00195 [Thermoplasmata archaeon]|nr:hypothetical protein [Thermoplasmata archaeon]
MKVFHLSPEIHMLGIVKGLVSESEKVNKYIQKFQPDTVGIGISSDELDGLKEYIKKGFELPALSTIEEIYAEKLAAFGDVGFPPPAFETIVAYCTDNEIPIYPLDIPEVEFTELYCNTVHTRDLIFQSFRIKRLRKKKLDVKAPEDFEIAWDGLVNKVGGFKKVEVAREKHMAKELKKLEGRVLAAIEIARAAGVARILEKGGKE